MKYYTRVFLSVIPIMACIKTCSISDLHEQFPNAKNIHKIHVQTKKYMFLAIKTGDTDEKHMDKNLILVINDASISQWIIYDSSGLYRDFDNSHTPSWFLYDSEKDKKKLLPVSDLPNKSYAPIVSEQKSKIMFEENAVNLNAVYSTVDKCISVYIGNDKNMADFYNTDSGCIADDYFHCILGGRVQFVAEDNNILNLIEKLKHKQVQ